jgi:hypothetical protein
MDGSTGSGPVTGAIMVGISARSQNTGRIPLRTLDVRQIRRTFSGERKASGMEQHNHSIGPAVGSPGPAGGGAGKINDF